MKISFKNKDLIRHTKAERINHNRHILQETLKEFHQAEGKRTILDRITCQHKGTKNIKNGDYIGKNRRFVLITQIYILNN